MGARGERAAREGVAAKRVLAARGMEGGEVEKS